MNLIWLDAKYLSQISFRLEGFKRKGNNTFNFKCPLCGDSKTNKKKARGYVYPSKGKLWFNCFNCNAVGYDVPKLIKHLDHNMYNEYILEMLKETGGNKTRTIQKEETNFTTSNFTDLNRHLTKLKKISSFDANSLVKKFITNRHIPNSYHHKLYFCKEFKTWTNTIIPNKFESITLDEPRLIIPFFDEEGQLFGYQGRAFKKDAELRYITIMIDESKLKLFGLDTVNKDKHIYVLEGPIDSMFVKNSIASCGSDITTNLNYISSDKSKFTIVYDNERRSKDAIKKMEKAIDHGFTVCIWPESIKQKDINDMYLNGYSQKKILDIINENSYNGLLAKARLSEWKRT
jgi:DNA primase